MIIWSGNTTPIFSLTQLCYSMHESRSPPVRVEVIDSSSCSDTFTSRLSYNASLGMGDSTKIIRIECSIVTDPTPHPECSPIPVPSRGEQNFTLYVTNCTGMYVWITIMLHYKKKCPNRWKSEPLTKGCFNCSFVHCGLLSLGSIHSSSPAIFTLICPRKGGGSLKTFMA